MKIAFAHMFTLRNPRGIERYVINVSNEMAELGHDVTVITGTCTDSPTRSWLDERVHVIEISHHNWHKLTFVPSFFRQFIKNDYDVVNLALAKGEGYAAGLAYFFRKFRYNIIFHYPFENHEKHVRAFDRFAAAACADRFIAVSEYVAKGIGGYFRRPVEVIPNGVDPRVFHPDTEQGMKLRQQLGIADTARIILTVSALQGRKGIHKVLDIVAAVKNFMPDIRYIVVGDGSEHERRELSIKVAALGLDENVIFVGNQSNVAPYYMAADIFVFLPDFEAFGIVVIEAMACGLPVVVPAGSAFPEILAHGGGVLLNQDSPEVYAEKIVSLLNDPGVLAEIGQQGISSVNGNFTWRSVAKRLETFFREQCH
jgi:glycosyltransferase involved in cell wall biosynthesis